MPGEGTPVVYCHGNPSHGEDWVPFMERGGPVDRDRHAGLGALGPPGPDQSSTTRCTASPRFSNAALEELGVGRRKLVVHDWGCLVLIGAQRRPRLVERLVVMNIVPFTPGFRWHWVAQIWRRRPFGEFVNATATKPSMALAMRQARGDRSPMPDQFLDSIWRYWDKGTSRAVLRLYRHADPDRLVAAGRDLGRIECPALVLWGDRDPYLPPRFGEDTAAALGNAQLEIRAGAGHWPWIDDPAIIDRVLEFLAE